MEEHLGYPKPAAEGRNNGNSRHGTRAKTVITEIGNSVLLDGDAADAVERLKSDDGPDLAVLGSGELVRCLLPRGLIDEMVLIISPIVLGDGQRLFDDDGAELGLELVEALPTTTGAITASYQVTT